MNEADIAATLDAIPSLPDAPRSYKVISLEKINAGHKDIPNRRNPFRVGHVETWTYKSQEKHVAMRSMRNYLEKVWGERWVDWKELP